MNLSTKTDISLSKKLSWLLRHGAIKEGLAISDDGYVSVAEILNHKSFKKQNVTVEDIRRVVEENNKKRFTLSSNPLTGDLLIKANQGHSMKVQDTSLEPILNVSETPIVVHGTYSRHWDSIQEQGLSRMNRLHIHFAPGEPGEEQVISGMRGNCDVYIYINISDALKDGIKFYRSSNNVILSPGNEQGIIEPKYFARVVHRPRSSFKNK